MVGGRTCDWTGHTRDSSMTGKFCLDLLVTKRLILEVMCLLCWFYVSVLYNKNNIIKIKIILKYNLKRKEYLYRASILQLAFLQDFILLNFQLWIFLFLIGILIFILSNLFFFSGQSSMSFDRCQGLCDHGQNQHSEHSVTSQSPSCCSSQKILRSVPGNHSSCCSSNFAFSRM